MTKNQNKLNISRAVQLASKGELEEELPKPKVTERAHCPSLPPLLLSFSTLGTNGPSHFRSDHHNRSRW